MIVRKIFVITFIIFICEIGNAQNYIVVIEEH